MKQIIICLLLSLAAYGETSFSGKWNGTGKMRKPDGTVYHCKEFWFVLDQKSFALDYLKGVTYCSPYGGFQWSQRRYEIREDKLYLDGNIVGEITDTFFDIDVLDPQGVYRLSGIFQPDGTLKVHQEYRNLVWDGTLKKSTD